MRGHSPARQRSGNASMGGGGGVKQERHAPSRSRSRSPSRRGGRGGPGHKDSNSKMIYISNLPYETRWVELKNVLREHGGELNFCEILEDRNGRSKGAAVAEFKTREDAEACVRSMGPRYDLNGRSVVVKEIREPVSFLRKIKEDTGIDLLATTRFSGQSAPQTAQPQERYETYGLSMDFLRTHHIELPISDRIFAANIPFNVTSGRLCDIFGMAGRITWIDVQTDKEGRSKGNCVIEYSHPLEAVQAISMFNNQKLLDRVLMVKMDKHQKVEERKPGELPRGLLTIGMGLGADGAPLKDVAAVLATLGKDNYSQPEPVCLPPQMDMPFGGLGSAPAPASFRPTVPSFDPSSRDAFGVGGGSNGGGFGGSVPGGAMGGGGNAFGGSGGGMGGGRGAQASVKLEPTSNNPFGGSSGGNLSNPFGGSGLGAGGAAPTYSTRTILIKNLPHDYTWQIVSDRLASFGDVDAVEMVGSGVARVRYQVLTDAERARQSLNGTIVEGRNIMVEYVY